MHNTTVSHDTQREPSRCGVPLRVGKRLGKATTAMTGIRRAEYVTRGVSVRPYVGHRVLLRDRVTHEVLR
eukprot:1410703-Prymnesium_polylepis.1